MTTDFIHAIKPGIPRRYLLFIAAIVWTFAGGMLLYRGVSLLYTVKDFVWLRILICTIAGGLFYFLLFYKISLKHSIRILNLKYDYPCMFSFFSLKSYIMMAIMITSGILLRKSGILSPGYMSELYITMGIPLFLSSLRFYYYGINYRQFKNISE